MKKVLVLATAAFLFTGVAFANGGGDGKKCGKCTKDCCSKKSTEKKDTKTAAKATAKKA
jgi:hypothetical protein